MYHLCVHHSRSLSLSLSIDRSIDFSLQTSCVARPGSARAVLLQKPMWKSLMAQLNAMEAAGTHAVHPKLVALGEVLESHFKRKAAAGVSTRAIVFTETRGR